jgi:hypothetical protein
VSRGSIYVLNEILPARDLKGLRKRHLAYRTQIRSAAKKAVEARVSHVSLHEATPLPQAQPASRLLLVGWRAF